MKNLKLTVFKILSITLGLCASTLMASNPTHISKRYFKIPDHIKTTDYMQKTVVIKIDPSFKNSAQRNSILIPSLQNIFLEIGAQEINSMFPNAKTNASRMPDGSKSPDITTIYRINYSADLSVEQVINKFLQHKEVLYAEPSYIYRTSYIPNDPDTSGTRNYYQKLIKAYQAWDISKGDTNVVIGIVDTGGDLDHPDLAANVKYNHADPIDGIDNDNDGYIDNYKGWDFVGASSANFVPDGDPNVRAGGNDHGVHVGGDASAVADNNMGIAGIGYKCKLLFIKCTPDNYENAIYTGYEGIVYAADQGASIINCSWGGAGGGNAGQDVIDYAVSKGALVVAAAGNNNSELEHFPSAYKNVLSIASTTSTDRKSSFSNYGFTIDISAPGTGIYSTVYDNDYDSYDGTSMAAPIAAGAAALVKSHFPHYTGMQVGEQLRVTADDISSANIASMKDKLGKGRINVYKALTVSSPSIRSTSIYTLDDNFGANLPGDTIDVNLEVMNYLHPTSNLSITLSSTSTAITIVDAVKNVGVIGTLQKQTVNSFKVFVKPNVAENTRVTLKFSYNDGSYTDAEFIVVELNVSTLNIQVNQIRSTATGLGRIGYRNGDATGGLGVIYKGMNLLYEAALMIAQSSTQVSNNARSESTVADNHFVVKERIRRIPHAEVDFFSRGEFTDSANPNQIGLDVKHRELAWSGNPDDKYFIVEYQMKNKNANALSNIYAGMFFDWDIGSDPALNRLAWDASLRLGYVQSLNASEPLAAVKVLTADVLPSFYGQSHTVPGDLQENGFSIAEKYTSLSSGIVNAEYGFNGPGIDAMYSIGAGPYNIAPDETKLIAFAIIAGDNLDEIKASAAAAQLKYDNVVGSLGLNNKSVRGLRIYPNPASSEVYILLPTKEKIELIVYDQMGRMILNESNSFSSSEYLKINTDKFTNGLYTIMIKSESGIFAEKLIINK